MAPETLAIAVSFLSLCFAVWIGLKGDKRTDVKDVEARAKENATINVKLDDISGTTKEIKQDIIAMNNEIRSQNDRLIRVEESAKQAHKRLDTLDLKLQGKEDDA